MADHTDEQLVNDLVSHLKLTQLDENLFIGENRPSSGAGHIYGGQVIAQAVSAASQTAPGKLCHSLTSHFYQNGDYHAPITFEVTPVRDGKSFTNRQVRALQGRNLLLTVNATFQTQLSGFSYARKASITLHANELPPASTYLEEFARQDRLKIYDFFVTHSAFEFRFSDTPSYISRTNREPFQQMWFRSKAPMTESPPMLRTILAYLSDLNLARTITLPFREQAGASGLQVASLNHSLWIHQTPDLNDWVLIEMRGLAAGNQRGLVMGEMLSSRGDHIATFMQECMIRQVDPSKNNRSFREHP